MARARLAGAAAMVTGLWAAERIRPPRGARPGTVPGSPGALTCDWLTDALCSSVPGARVVGFSVGAGSDGTSARRPLRVDYNDAGREAQLPSPLYTKSAPSLLSRLFCGLNRIGELEGAFYLRIAPELKIETPTAHAAVWEQDSGRFLLILEDIVASRGVTFCDPTITRVTREQADDMVDIMATYHGRFWGSPRLDSEFVWLIDSADGQRRLNEMMGFRRMFTNGLKRSRDILPKTLVAREDEMWPALMRSLELDEGRPLTLIHQDTHLRNWYYTDAGRMGICDWQACGKGPWAYDVSYALACGLTIEDRRSWEHELLDRYAATLGAVAPTREQAWLSYRQHIMHGLAYWLATIGRTMLQPELQPHEVCVAHLQRLGQAAEDLQMLDAISA